MAQARRQRVPSLKELLVEAKRHQVSVMFDLMPLEDPHYERLVNITVETILKSGIDQELVSFPHGEKGKSVVLELEILLALQMVSRPCYILSLPQPRSSGCLISFGRM